MLLCMILTATTELGTQSWVERTAIQAHGTPYSFLVTGLVGRYFADLLSTN
jgi:hypothetical protein